MRMVTANLNKRRLWWLVAALSVLVLLLPACSPAQRLSRLMARHPYLAADTVLVVHDTVIVPGGVAFDTLLSVRFDTVRLDGERVLVTMIKHDSSIKVRVETKTDTVIMQKAVSVPVYRPVIQKKRWPWLIIPVVLGEILLLIVILKFRLI